MLVAAKCVQQEFGVKERISEQDDAGDASLPLEHNVVPIWDSVA